jgi:seryl-tRNA synthetase
MEMIKGFSDYEKNNMMSYADNNENSLIFVNPSYSSLSEKVLKLKQEMINPFSAFKNWLEEELLDVEAMLLAIKQIYGLLEKEEQLKDKLNTLEEDIKKGQSGQVSFIKGLFKKKEDIIAEIEKEKEVTQQKINDIQTIIRIVGDNMENQIEVFKSEKTKSYYKYLKMFAILQRESNRVVRELWTLVKNALNDISPNAGQDEEF